MTAFDEITIRLPDGYRCYGMFYRQGKPRGAVLYHCGIQSHCGWFETSASRLAEAGLAVLQVDRRGSGRNEADRGHADSAEQLIDDARAAGDVLIEMSGDQAYHVVGVSWGGKLAVAAYMAHSGRTISLSLVTPGLFPRMAASSAEKARIGFAMLYEPRQLFDIPLNDATLLTSNACRQQFIQEDQLTLRQCTAAFYLSSRRMDKNLRRLADSPRVRIHLMVAGDEQIIDNDETANFIRKLSWPGCRITHYPHARHTLEFEADRETFFGDLVEFIEAAQRCPRPTWRGVSDDAGL